MELSLPGSRVGLGLGGSGWAQALQRSEEQQVQLLLAQLLSVVQPFSPLSAEEKRKNQLLQTQQNTISDSRGAETTEEEAKHISARRGVCEEGSPRV